MRVTTKAALCLLLLSLAAGPAAAQTLPPPAPAGSSFELPVSLERIRRELARPEGESILDSIDVRPHFRVTVEERRPSFVEMFNPESFKGGFVPPGGLYAWEQQRMLFPNSTPVGGVNLLPLFGELFGGVRAARRAGAEARAREEVARAMAAFCAAQPNQGAGIVGCAAK
jgi:hypothetical protein